MYLLQRDKCFIYDDISLLLKKVEILFEWTIANFRDIFLPVESTYNDICVAHKFYKCVLMITLCTHKFSPDLSMFTTKQLSRKKFICVRKGRFAR